MIRQTVRLGARSYPIYIGADAVSSCAAAIASACPGRRAAVVTDENVWRLHGRRLSEILTELGLETGLSVLPPGEGSKTLGTLERLCVDFHRHGLRRGDPVIAFGGGVVGDAAGFAAATYMRGVPLIQIPTTLLAQVDSSVGGKVAVNSPSGKNLIGCFYQPRLVVADTEVLATLPQREWRSGMAEVIKYAAIGAKGLEETLCWPDALRKHLEKIVSQCCSCKAEFVEDDERDNGARMILNFGHTFGHAIEKNHGFSRYTHGEAVAIGMRLAVRIGAAMGVTDPKTAETLDTLINAYGLDTRCPDAAAVLVPLMAGDKKNSGGDITLVLLQAMGKPVVRSLGADELMKAWEGIG